MYFHHFVGMYQLQNINFGWLLEVVLALGRLVEKLPQIFNNWKMISYSLKKTYQNYFVLNRI